MRPRYYCFFYVFSDEGLDIRRSTAGPLCQQHPLPTAHSLLHEASTSPRARPRGAHHGKSPGIWSAERHVRSTAAVSRRSGNILVRRPPADLRAPTSAHHSSPWASIRAISSHMLWNPQVPRALSIGYYLSTYNGSPKCHLPFGHGELHPDGEWAVISRHHSDPNPYPFPASCRVQPISNSRLIQDHLLSHLTSISRSMDFFSSMDSNSKSPAVMPP